MQYSLTGISTHLDLGFGITGESYYYSAEYLYNHKDQIQTLQQADMPMNFLYRHSIELFLKSLIVIFHKRLQLLYGTDSYNSPKPKILIHGVWKDLFNCHQIDDLYNYWIKELLINHQSELARIAPNGIWQEEIAISGLFPLIAGYDRDSLYFRYPVTKNISLDSKKYTMQRLDLEKFKEMFSKDSDNKKNKGDSRIFMLLKNNNDEILNGFVNSENVLENVVHALKEISNYLFCFHVMTRITLCNGN